MQYGWLGKRAMMKVDNEMLEPEAYDEFIEYALGYQADFEKIAMKRSKPKTIEKKDEPEVVAVQAAEETTVEMKEEEGKKTPKALAQAGAFAAGVGVAAAAGLGAAAALVPIAGASAAMGITKGINKMQVHKKVKDQQYRALSVILYIDGLQEFLEG